MKIVTLLFFLCQIVFAATQTCNHKSCGNCVKDPGGECGWCAPTQTCLQGNITGPAVGKCLGDAWEFNACTLCSALKDCRQCRSRNLDCGWCAQTATNGICFDLENGKPNGTKCLIGHSCPCSVYATCDQCLEDPKCHFCAGDHACKAGNQACVNPGPNVYNNMTCPCNLTHNCDICRDTPGCEFCYGLGCVEFGSDPDCNATSNCNAYCNEFTSCTQCKGVVGCQWAASKQCIDPEVVSAPIAHSCVECSFLSYCETCNAEPDCAWCSETGNCHSKQGSPCNHWALGCDGYCMKYTGCDACNAIKGCGWCDDLGECHTIQTTQCLFAHDCSPGACPACGFDAGSFVGGMFLPIGVVLLVYAGYRFYTWKVGSKNSYTELK